MVRAALGHLVPLFPALRNRLPRLHVIRDGVVIGSIHEDEGLTSTTGRGRIPKWVYQGPTRAYRKPLHLGFDRLRKVTDRSQASQANSRQLFRGTYLARH